jgi:hypothetical protein
MIMPPQELMENRILFRMAFLEKQMKKWQPREKTEGWLSARPWH